MYALPPFQVPAEIRQAAPVVPVQGGGFVLVPPAGPQAADTRDAAALAVTARAATMEQARDLAIAGAGRQAAARGLPGSPHILAESFSMGVYNATVSFPPASAGQPAAGGGDPPVPTGRDDPPPPRKPAWILVLAAEAADGDRSAVWGRESAWSRAWVAPVRKSGMRIVSTLGDADDRDRLTPRMLATPDDGRTEQAALAVARKYGAPAVALVLRRQDGGTRAWLWRAGGGQAETGDAPPGTDGGKSGALDLLASLAIPAASTAHEPAAEAADVAAEVAAGPGATPEVDLEEHAEYARDGSFGFAVVLDSRNPSEAAAVRRAVTGIRGLAIRTVETDGDGLEVTGNFPGSRAGLEKALADAGLRVAHYR
jgi:hypothetical protein